ncbi:hypothetical protein KUTeg_021897 [Tegillarca granosa]|uniref:Uncharacterized protein n=1 Tax=Tegillarca granosa TaxID=220873 RepID=A0ABQ9E4N0_TEGGR|nr:hypothetical protein KUTeg_021897 [Tegillarca granosa]
MGSKIGVGYYFWSDIKGSVGVGKTETTLEDEEKVEQPKSETKETKNQKSSLDRPLEEKVEQSKSETKGTKTQKSSWDRPLEEKFFKKLKNDSKHFKVIEKRVDVKVEEKLKTVAIYGEKDETTMVQESKNSFKHLPDHEFITIEGAGHPAYLANPDKFHSILCNFLFDVFS